ncbi:hypothetical protein BDB00DRAFT_871421 [Zychaea mexicana]|uniref:uncharacterized protein n=1 Tax=Zychaea mexicana TaxID=64656 RepID=UPI0022FF2438|nr:uncharacterized protein BDB00DRAFT_871421 [Zychaea mexicana]KAI9494331.1 hypothetical protein BDB00DRAFT_871421 [Zychaea mexicana]
MGLPTELFLSIGTRYIITCNVDTSDGLVNGAMFKYEPTDRKQREKCRSLMEREGISGWTPLEHVTKLIKPRPESTVGIIRMQFPLTHVEAITRSDIRSRGYRTASKTTQSLFALRRLFKCKETNRSLSDRNFPSSDVFSLIDAVYLTSDFLLFAETWTLPSDTDSLNMIGSTSSHDKTRTQTEQQDALSERVLTLEARRYPASVMKAVTALTL